MNDLLKIASLGPGVMGGPMAGHLARAAFSVTAYNRSPGLAAPVTALVDQFHADVHAAGRGRKDTSASTTRLPRCVTNEG